MATTRKSIKETKEAILAQQEKTVKKSPVKKTAKPLQEIVKETKVNKEDGVVKTKPKVIKKLKVEEPVIATPAIIELPKKVQRHATGAPGFSSFGMKY